MGKGVGDGARACAGGREQWGKGMQLTSGQWSRGYAFSEQGMVTHAQL